MEKYSTHGLSLVPKIHGQKQNWGQWATTSHTWPLVCKIKRQLSSRWHLLVVTDQLIKNNIVYFIKTIFIIIKRNYLSLQLGSTFTVCNTLISILKFALSTLNLKYFHKFLCPFYPHSSLPHLLLFLVLKLTFWISQFTVQCYWF